MAQPLVLCLPWAVHIADNILTWPWLAGGFAAAGVLGALAAWRVRDEEVPRIALLASAFFVASLMHVSLGPTSVHLLLNGLVGVVLGRRAALAIPLGLCMQAALLGHGGFTTLGVNACVLTVPALLAGALFRVLHRPSWLRGPGCRAVLVATSTLAWSLALVFSVALIATNRWSHSATLDPWPALHVLYHPAVLGGALLLAVLSAAWERRLDQAPEFSLGVLVGLVAFLATLVLNALVLLYGGEEDWHALVLLVFVAHLPLAVLESVILGFTVSFLARVKPEMLGIAPSEQHTPAAVLTTPLAAQRANGERAHAVASASGSSHPPLAPPAVLLLALVGVLLGPGAAQAHRLDAEYTLLPDGRVQVESWFDIGNDSPTGARVQVFRPDGHLLTEGKLDEKGIFVFAYERAETLRVVVSAGAGHRKELTIPLTTLGDAGQQKSVAVEQGIEAATPGARAVRERDWLKDVLAGVGLLLGAGALMLSVRMLRQIEQIKQSLLGPARTKEEM